MVLGRNSHRKEAFFLSVVVLCRFYWIGERISQQPKPSSGGDQAASPVI
jgi:hypothetical protein